MVSVKHSGVQLLALSVKMGSRKEEKQEQSGGMLVFFSTLAGLSSKLKIGLFAFEVFANTQNWQ